MIRRQPFLAGEDDGEEQIGARGVQINRKFHFAAHVDPVVGAEANPLQARHVQVRLDHRTQLEQVVFALWYMGGRRGGDGGDGMWKYI